MSEDTHDFRKTVNLANVQKLEDFHFKAKACINQEEDQISHLGNVNHTVDIVVAF